MRLRIRLCDYERLLGIAAISFTDALEFPPETGCIILLGQSTRCSHPSLTVAGIMKAVDGDFEIQGADALRFSSRYLRKALMEVRERGLAGFLTVHTHPMSTNQVRFSSYDDACDPDLMQNLCELQPGASFGSMVLGKASAQGRLWNPQRAAFLPLSALTVVGDAMSFLPLDGGPSPHATGSAAEIFDRALAVTGHGALAVLSTLRVGVVGAGGTGSLVVELLARAGVCEIVVFDFDHADQTNLNRVLHLRTEDVVAERSKADRLKDVIAESGLPTSVTVIQGGNITETGAAVQLAGCDVLIGCVDRDWPRLVLSEVSRQYLIPYIDIGTEIGVSDGEVCSLDVRASFVEPGAPCLLCRKLISMERIRLEGYGQEELARVLAMGYSADIRLSAPAVMELNMKAASWATLILRHLLQPFLARPLPHCIRESLTNFNTRSRWYETDPGCALCGDSTRIGVGDTHPLSVRQVEGSN